VVVSADGKSVYYAAFASDDVARFDRDPATGSLTYQGCISSDSNTAGCTLIFGAVANGVNTGLDGLYSVTATADGKSVYTASQGGDAVARFDRDPATGALTYDGCITSNNVVPGCTLTPGAAANGPLDAAVSVTASADGKSVYATSQNADAVVRFDREPEPPAVEPPPPAQPPSNQFSFGKLKLNRHKGTAKLNVEVPGPGELVVSGKKLKPAATVATAAGELSLVIKAKGKAAKKRRERGKVKLKANVTYTPTGGTPSTQQEPVKLIRLPHTG
jgi:hypothetical protein